MSAKAKYNAWASGNVFPEIQSTSAARPSACPHCACSGQTYTTRGGGMGRPQSAGHTSSGAGSHRPSGRVVREVQEQPSLLFEHKQQAQHGQISITSNTSSPRGKSRGPEPVLEIPPSVLPPPRRTLKPATRIATSRPKSAETGRQPYEAEHYHHPYHHNMQNCPLRKLPHPHHVGLSGTAQFSHENRSGIMQPSAKQHDTLTSSQDQRPSARQIQVEFHDEDEIYDTIEREALLTIAQQRLFEPAQLRRYLIELYNQNRHLNTHKLRQRVIALAESLEIRNLVLDGESSDR